MGPLAVLGCRRGLQRILGPWTGARVAGRSSFQKRKRWRRSWRGTLCDAGSLACHPVVVMMVQLDISPEAQGSESDQAYRDDHHPREPRRNVVQFEAFIADFEIHCAVPCLWNVCPARSRCTLLTRPGRGKRVHPYIGNHPAKTGRQSTTGERRWSAKAIIDRFTARITSFVCGGRP